MKQSESHVLFLLTHGFAARMTLRAGIVRRLVDAGSRVTVLSPNAGEEYFRRECTQEGASLQESLPGAGRLAGWFRLHRAYLLDDVMSNPALRSMHLRRFEGRAVAASLFEGINRTTCRHRFLRRVCRDLEKLVNRSGTIRSLLKRLEPDLLVIPNPFGTHETVYLLHARELGIPVACQMMSWDNITSKGTPLLMPDSFISWGPVMTQEMVELYGFPRTAIYECGVPHFDVYTHRDRFTGPATLLRELGLPEDEPYLFYGMVTGIHCPNEIELLTWLAERVNKRAFARPCSLVIRPHPQRISGEYSSDRNELERLVALAGDRVAVEMPPVQSARLAWDLPRSDMYRLASFLAGSAMCLNSNSTLCLDAAVLDRPVINVGFDGAHDLPYEKSARRVLNYTHMAKLLRMGGIRVARSYTELGSHVNDYLKDPRLDNDRRAFSVAQECGTPDGHAAERVANVLLSLSRRQAKQFAHESTPSYASIALE